jgi:hypothetical protein
MFRKQITIALACAGLICAATTGSTINTSKPNATAPQLVLVARSGQPGGNQGKPRSAKPSSKPHTGKPIVAA